MDSHPQNTKESANLYSVRIKYMAAAIFISIYVCECSYVFMYVCVYLSIAGKEKLPFTPLGSLTGQ